MWLCPHVVDLGVDPLERRLRLAAVPHEHDPLHHVRLAVVPDDAEARRVADVHVGDVPDAHGRALLLGDDDVLDVRCSGGPRPEEADAAHVVALLAHEEAIAADVLVRVLDRAGHLTERHAVAAQAVGVDLDVVLLRLAAVARDVDDALDLLELSLEDPVLRGLEVLEACTPCRRRGSGTPRRSRSRATAAPGGPSAAARTECG